MGLRWAADQRATRAHAVSDEERALAGLDHGALEGGDPVRAARRLPVALLDATKAGAAGEP